MSQSFDASPPVRVYSLFTIADTGHFFSAVTEGGPTYIFASLESEAGDQARAKPDEPSCFVRSEN